MTSPQERTDSRKEPLVLSLYVKASNIDQHRVGACLFCQEYWMELYTLFLTGIVRVEVLIVNLNSEACKNKFLGAQPPMLEESSGIMYSDNREIESRIFQLAQDCNIALFEKDDVVEKQIDNLYRNFKLFSIRMVDLGKNRPLSIDALPPDLDAVYKKYVEKLVNINKLLCERNTRYLLSDVTVTQYDCELMPRLHHIRIAGSALLNFEIPHELTHLWKYILTAYKTPAFVESCPADQDIIRHYKEQLKMTMNQVENLQQPTKTLNIPDDVFSSMSRLDTNTP
ncbi:chloride intracellular channel exc-4 [Ditylenchus destructor]|uniref:Chloride intracellular channel exc-4 n=1 Tax=Ditylenchus destructor TaxID=166010 RepID=A0AAD4NAQ8_9BILA|nr:chloride intracellular channel exc-4 [Ditylenchus destructor]